MLAQIVGDSLHPNGSRLTTMLLEYWLPIHAELMTHREFSRNAASSRAIPIERILNKPVVGPVRWGINGKGMQDHGEHERPDTCERVWWRAAQDARRHAHTMHDLGLHKQIVNRVMAPYTTIRVLVSSTYWGNFFAQRCHKDAQPEMQQLADAMLEAIVHSEPRKLEYGQWHVPFSEATTYEAAKVAVARAAWVSYDAPTKDGNAEATFEKLIACGHWSPLEHAAKVCIDGKDSNFAAGWTQMRKLYADEYRTCDYKELYEVRQRR